MTTSPSLPFLLLLASADYTALAARHTYDDEGYAFFRVEDGSLREERCARQRR